MAKSHPRWRLAKKVLTWLFLLRSSFCWWFMLKGRLGRCLDRHPRL